MVGLGTSRREGSLLGVKRGVHCWVISIGWGGESGGFIRSLVGVKVGTFNVF